MPITLDLMGEFNTAYPGLPENVEQRSFYFEQSPEVYFVGDKGEIVENYDQLSVLNLTKEEQELLTQQPEPKSNEPQILLQELRYNKDKVFLKAYKCDYKFLVAYASGKVFPNDSPIYNQPLFKTGSIAALITSDDKTVIIERNDDLKLFSSFSGFLKPPSVKEENVAIATAVEESEEEFFRYTEIELQDPRIGSLSFRKDKTNDKFGTAEFIVPIRVSCIGDELKQALDSYLTAAKKPDGSPDHTGRYKLIDLNKISEKDFEIIEKDGSTKQVRKLSSFLVDPIINTLCHYLGLKAPQFMQKESLNHHKAIN
jgi:hypothetical protein